MFFQSKVFREETVARRARPDPLDERLQVMAPHEWMVLAGLGLSLLAFLAWGAFGSVQRHLSTEAVLLPFPSACEEPPAAPSSPCR